MAILYTSGTTGPSKGALLSHAHYYFIAAQANQYMRYDENSILYSCLPLFHANASAMSALGAVLAEATYAMGKRFSLTTFWDESGRIKQPIRMCWVLSSLFYGGNLQRRTTQKTP
jgi:crotonobetaine/carnitine-CoA ligase